MTRLDDKQAQMKAWEEGLRAGEAFKDSQWQWSAGSISRAMNGLTERPQRPTNPYTDLEPGEPR